MYPNTEEHKDDAKQKAGVNELFGHGQSQLSQTVQPYGETSVILLTSHIKHMKINQQQPNIKSVWKQNVAPNQRRGVGVNHSLQVVQYNAVVKMNYQNITTTYIKYYNYINRGRRKMARL